MLQRQRKKEKRSNHFKEVSRKKLSGYKFPYGAIIECESRNQAEMKLLQSSAKSEKSTKRLVETLYADVFLCIICKIGCRPSVLTGLTYKEFNL